MVRIAIYGEALSEKHYSFIKEFFKLLDEHSFEYIIYKKFKDSIESIVEIKKEVGVFSHSKELVENSIQCVISIGGDGTMLNSFQFVLKTSILVFGFNTGRLGFLSNVTTEQVSWALNELALDRYESEERSVLEIQPQDSPIPYYAFNEVTIHKQDTSSMLTIHTMIDKDFVNSYWADGVIVSTPTGSTAYSLSCGGPILMPKSNNLMITPIAPHNLNVRPIVFSDDKAIKLRVESRSGNFLLAMDSNSITLSTDQEVFVKQASFSLKLLKFSDYNYFNMLRSKLMWGVDKRN